MPGLNPSMTMTTSSWSLYEKQKTSFDDSKALVRLTRSRCVRVTIIAQPGAEVASLDQITPEAGHTAVSRSASAITMQHQYTTTAPLTMMASQHQNQ